MPKDSSKTGARIIYDIRGLCSFGFFTNTLFFIVGVGVDVGFFLFVVIRLDAFITIVIFFYFIVICMSGIKHTPDWWMKCHWRCGRDTFTVGNTGRRQKNDAPFTCDQFP